MSEQLTIYEGLPAASTRKIERCAVAIDKAKAKGVALIFEIGKQLQVAHDELANHGDGTFGKWVVERCGMTRECARQYLNANEVFGKHESLVCQPGCQTFDAKALYYLSRDTTPEEAIADALKRAKKGERITLAEAKGCVAAYTVNADEDAPEEEEQEEEFGWDVLSFDSAVRKETLRWWNVCPAEERESIPEILRRIADKMEKRINGHSS